MAMGESWQLVHRGRLASVLAERSLYAADDRSALVRVRITNTSPRRLGVDLSDSWNVVYPNQWSISPAPRLDPHGSVDYFREFDTGRPTESELSGAYLLISLSGQLWVTDGQEAEGLTLFGASPDKRDLVLPLPLRWQPIPVNARVVRHP